MENKNSDALELRVLTPDMVRVYSRVLADGFVEKAFNIMKNYRSHGFDISQLRDDMKDYLEKHVDEYR